jgi:hypothetical protein
MTSAGANWFQSFVWTKLYAWTRGHHFLFHHKERRHGSELNSHLKLLSANRNLFLIQVIHPLIKKENNYGQNLQSLEPDS